MDSQKRSAIELIVLGVLTIVWGTVVMGVRVELTILGVISIASGVAIAVWGKNTATRVNIYLICLVVVGILMMIFGLSWYPESRGGLAIFLGMIIIAAGIRRMFYEIHRSRNLLHSDSHIP